MNDLFWDKCAVESLLCDYKWALMHHENKEDEIRKKYAERIVLTIYHNCTALFSVEEMEEALKTGSIDPYYDGYGYWLDKDFNQICAIDSLGAPQNAVWADWINK